MNNNSNDALDAKRWRFFMAMQDNLEGPEARAAFAGFDPDAAETLRSEMEELVDKGMATTKWEEP